MDQGSAEELLKGIFSTSLQGLRSIYVLFWLDASFARGLTMHLPPLVSTAALTVMHHWPSERGVEVDLLC